MDFELAVKGGGKGAGGIEQAVLKCSLVAANRVPCGNSADAQRWQQPKEEECNEVDTKPACPGRPAVPGGRRGYVDVGPPAAFWLSYREPVASRKAIIR